MKGLEATTARSSQLERTARIDAEYFQKRFLRSAALIEKWDREHVAVLTHVSDGNHFSISEDFVDEGVPYYRGQDVTGRFFAETAEPIHITREAYDQKHMVRSHLKKGDVLLSIIGTIGELSLVASDDPATCSCKLAILRPRKVSPEFLAVFLRSEHGQNQIERMTRGAVQQGLILEDMDQLWVPKISCGFEKRIVKTVRASRATRDLTTRKQAEAEEALLSALGMADWTPPEPLAYQARLSDYELEKRLDAQFFQPKYFAVRGALEDRFDLVHLEGFVLKGRTVPYSENGTVPIIRSGDLKDIDDEARFLRSTADEPIFYLKRGDVLISSIGFGSIGKVQVFDKGGRYGTVSEVTVVRQDVFNPYYLTAFLRSQFGQMQIERYITGATGQLHLKPSDVERFYVPRLPCEKQVVFEEVYKAGRDAKARAIAQLDAAKRAVEIAIEEGEPAAIAYLGQAEGAI